MLTAFTCLVCRDWTVSPFLVCITLNLHFQAGELSENSLISEIFVSISENIRQVFLLNAYVFRDFVIFLLIFQRFFSTLCSPP
jgi:hypothetical protein